MSTTGTVARILSVLLVLAGSALASPVVSRSDPITCLYNNMMEFTNKQAAVLLAQGPTGYPPRVKPELFTIFLKDCCAKADSNHQSTGSAALFDAVSGDKKAADNVDKLSTPGERLSSTHVDPSAHDDDPSSHANANANVDSSSQNGNANASGNTNVDPTRTGENEDSKIVSGGLRTGQNSVPNTDGAQLFKPKIAAVHLPSVPSTDVESAPMPQKDVADHQSTTSHVDDSSLPSVHTNSQNGNGNLNGDANGNTDVDPSLRTGKKDEQLENAFHGSNEDPDLADAATDLTSGQHHSLHVLSASTAPQKDVANHQSTTNANVNTHGNTDAHSQSTTPAVEKTGSSIPVLGAMGGDGKCKCPL